MEQTEESIYTRVGGMSTFYQLAQAFYEGVEKDTVLRPLYPESLEEPRLHLALFLAQFFGGPTDYSQRRGHPRLRARHLPFKIGRAERDAWVKHMLAALDTVEMPDSAHAEMKDYFERAATFLINQLD